MSFFKPALVTRNEGLALVTRNEAGAGSSEGWTCCSSWTCFSSAAGAALGFFCAAPVAFLFGFFCAAFLRACATFCAFLFILHTKRLFNGFPPSGYCSPLHWSHWHRLQSSSHAVSPASLQKLQRPLLLLLGSAGFRGCWVPPDWAVAAGFGPAADKICGGFGPGALRLWTGSREATAEAGRRPTADGRRAGGPKRAAAGSRWPAGPAEAPSPRRRRRLPGPPAHYA